MAAISAAQDEFDALVANAARTTLTSHPEDVHDSHHDRNQNYDRAEQDEESRYTERKIDEVMRAPVPDRYRGSGYGTLGIGDGVQYDGARTGVKGVIADARSYEMAKRSEGKGGRPVTSNTITGAKTSAHARLLPGRGRGTDAGHKRMSFLDNASEDEADEVEEDIEQEDEEFLEQWRQSRRMELMTSGRGVGRRTSPSVRRYGRWDEVDALGYLDAIEKVGRETVVVVFVHDDECPVSTIVWQALAPLAQLYTTVRFVRVAYDDIEFDNAGVPAVLAYRNQGDLFANLTYIVDQIPEGADVNSDTVRDVLRKFGVV